MKKIYFQKQNISLYFLITVFLIFGIFFLYYSIQSKQVKQSIQNQNVSQEEMKIISPTFSEGEIIPSTYTCDGKNINFPLQFSNIPQQTASLALIIDDPDAPLGTFTHWMVWNIKPNITEIPEHSVPEFAVQGINSWGGESYRGPCPPSGEHRYITTLYALDSGFGTPANKTREDINRAIKGHIIGEARLMGKYKRL
jgi:Raf kinase inhibitor-like YbhB/YbcL family protein